MKKILWVIAGLTFLSVLNAQETVTPQAAERTDVFAPFVSRLRVAVRDPQVRLTWRDATDLESGTYEVFRHTQEINKDTIGGAELVATVETGTETYLDTPLQEGDYYYAVLARSTGGELYQIFVPFRNVTIRAITVQQLETEEDLAASIYDIEAQIQDETVIVRFDASRNGRDLVVYRSAAPITAETDLTSITLLDQFTSSTRRFVDTPVPGVSYYYGVFDSVLVQNGSYTVSPDENVTTTPILVSVMGTGTIRVEIPAANARKTPLPFIQLASGIRPGGSVAPGSAAGTRNAEPVTLATREAIASLISLAPTVPPFSPNPVIFPEERAGDQEGAARTLSQVVMGDFTAGRYVDSASLFRSILTLPLSRTMETRVRFYLAQSLYFSGERENAFLEFLLVSRSGLYEEAKPWMDGILTG